MSSEEEKVRKARTENEVRKRFFFFVLFSYPYLPTVEKQGMKGQNALFGKMEEFTRVYVCACEEGSMSVCGDGGISSDVCNM